LIRFIHEIRKKQRDFPYKAIFLIAKQLIGHNINVIIDAALYSNKLVSEARLVTSESKVIQVICSESVTKKRLKERVSKSDNIYSAGPRVYDFMKSITEKITGIDYTVDTSKEIEQQLKNI